MCHLRLCISYPKFKNMIYLNELAAETCLGKLRDYSSKEKQKQQKGNTKS